MSDELGHSITEHKHIHELFEMINSKLVGTEKKLDIYLIGGGALMFHNAKASTKDIDVIMASDSQLELMENVLCRLGFAETPLSDEYGNFALDKMFIDGDYRLDVFNQKVCGKLSISSEMISRSKVELSLSNVKLHVLSKEDIFVFKSITTRDGDVEDSANIIKQGIDWRIVKTELLAQIEKSGIHKWITLFNERLDRLDDEYSLKSPIAKEIRTLAEIELKNFLKISNK
jgi:hypothetical protein